MRYHRLRGGAGTVLTSTEQVIIYFVTSIHHTGAPLISFYFHFIFDEEWQFWPLQNRNLRTYCNKVWHNWLCPRWTTQTKFGTNPSTCGFWAHSDRLSSWELHSVNSTFCVICRMGQQSVSSRYHYAPLLKHGALKMHWTLVHYYKRRKLKARL